MKEKICSICHKTFKKPTKYCSSECYRAAPKSDEFRAKISAIHKGKQKSLHMREALSKSTTGKPKPWQQGENNVNFGGKYTHDPHVREKFLKSVKKRGLAWTEEHKKQHSEKMLGECNAMRGKKHSEEVKCRISETQKQRYKDGLVKISLNKISKAEREIASFLQESKIDYKSQFHIKGVSYTYDFYLSKFNLIIEYQGDYWHANPNKYKSGTYINLIKKGQTIVDDIWARDKLKKESAEQAGYKIKYIWESDYKKHGITILQEIIKKFNG